MHQSWGAHSPPPPVQPSHLNSRLQPIERKKISISMILAFAVEDHELVWVEDQVPLHKARVCLGHLVQPLEGGTIRNNHKTLSP